MVVLRTAAYSAAILFACQRNNQKIVGFAVIALYFPAFNDELNDYAMSL